MSSAPDTANKYPSEAEFVAMGHKARTAHPKDSEQMFYAALRLACDWSRERIAAAAMPYKYYFRFQDGEEEYIDADNEERLAEIVEHNSQAAFINQIAIVPLYAHPQAPNATEGGNG